ncbi:unnamed protein product [Closterium sp. Naga37s-1]|nr:unnamed protein product [Closterium sp. Naga37s-1]
MLVGFISIVLARIDPLIVRLIHTPIFHPICVPPPGSSRADAGGIHLHCAGSHRPAHSPMGQEPFMSPSGVHQLHLFIFFLALGHILYSCITIIIAHRRVWVSGQLALALQDSAFQHRHGTSLTSLDASSSLILVPPLLPPCTHSRPAGPRPAGLCLSAPPRTRPSSTATARISKRPHAVSPTRTHSPVPSSTPPASSARAPSPPPPPPPSPSAPEASPTTAVAAPFSHCFPSPVSPHARTPVPSSTPPASSARAPSLPPPTPPSPSVLKAFHTMAAAPPPSSPASRPSPPPSASHILPHSLHETPRLGD